MRKYQQSLLFLVLAVTLVVVAVKADGTADSGDSVTHYLFSHYAFAHPANFFDHWAKPVFVLLSAPFASFGFIGMKIFNVFIALFTAFLLVRIAKRTGIRNTLLAPLFLFAFPMYTICIFSGLTEPLFGGLLVLGLYLVTSGRSIAGIIVLSFLPFCRSEGLVVILVVAFYLLQVKRPRQLPWLITGHVVYALAGYFYNGDLWWVITKIPYVGQEQIYGHGGWLHYFRSAAPIFGIPLTVLTAFGLLALPSFVKRSEQKKEVLLIAGCFLSVYASHVIFWKFGLFHSDGLLRVMVAVLPLAALIALIGLNKLIEFAARANSNFAFVINRILLVYVFVFPFMPNPAALQIPGDFSLKDDQLMLNDAAGWIKQEYPRAMILSEHNYASMALGLDPFDKKQVVALHNYKLLKEIPGNMIIIWDNWFGLVEAGVSLEELEKDERLVKKATFEKGNAQIVLFCKGR